MRLAMTLVISCIATNLVAQDVPLEIARSRANRIRLVSILNQSQFRTELGLSTEQASEIQRMREDYMKAYKEKQHASLGVEPGEKVTGNFFDIARRQGQEAKDELKGMEDIFSAQLSTVLTPEQLDHAEQIILRERIGAIGFEAILASDDLAIARLGLTHSEQEIRREFDAATDASDERIAELSAEFRKKVSEIRKEEIERALDRLGKDGEAIRVLISQLPELDLKPRRPIERRER